MIYPKFVRSILICDDIRYENTGKEIAIGLYPGEIVVPGFPSPTQSLRLRVELFLDGVNVSSIEVRIKTPSDKIFFMANMSFKFNNLDAPGSVVFSLENISFFEAGQYPISIRFPDGEWESASMLMVRRFESAQTRVQVEHALEQLQKLLSAISDAANTPPRSPTLGG